MSEFVIECKGLSKAYEDGASKVQVLQNVNLQVRPGEMLAIVGNSGSGKSTLLHLLGGLDKSTGGTVRINDQNIAILSEKNRCRLRNQYLGFVYQFHHLLPEFTALENAAMPLLIRNTPVEFAKKKAEEILDQVGLKDRLQHKVGELSGGERQRVAIARALVTEPLCVLADEPTGNLDPKNADKVFQLFLDLQKTFQTSVIMVTHDYKLAQKSHKVMTLVNGGLVDGVN